MNGLALTPGTRLGVYEVIAQFGVGGMGEEVLAAPNHPNIAQIHGLEKSDSPIALVMELVEGPTLADRIAQGAIPIDEALPIAKQIAEAFKAARTGHNNDNDQGGRR